MTNAKKGNTDNQVTATIPAPVLNNSEIVIEEQLSFIDELLELPILSSFFLKQFGIEIELRGNLEDTETVEYLGSMLTEYREAYIIGVRQKEHFNSDGSFTRIETGYLPLGRLNTATLTPYSELYDWFNADQKARVLKSILKQWSITEQKQRIESKVNRDAQKIEQNQQINSKMDKFLSEQNAVREKLGATRKRRSIKK